MGTAPTPGYIYLIESDGTLNDDWITDHSGDPDLLDLDQYTEGTEYCKIKIPEDMMIRPHTGIVVTPSGGGKSFAKRVEARYYTSVIRGIVESRAAAKLIDQFVMSKRHTTGNAYVAGDATTYHDYYLVIYFGVNDHWSFTDDAGTQQSYCKGAVISAPLKWSEDSNQIVNVALNWASVW